MAGRQTMKARKRTIDYRESHQLPAKVRRYHRKFAQNPHRAMMWELEKSLLNTIVLGDFPEQKPAHLDFACGTGRVLRHLQKHCRTSVGIDVSRAMLEVAEREIEDVELLHGDITRQDLLAGRTFSLITAFRFFPNAQPELQRESLRTLAGLLESEGIIVFNNHKNSSSLVYTMARVLRLPGKAGMSRKEVEALVSECGLEIVAVHHLGVFPSTEGCRLLPARILLPLERWLSHIPWLRPWGSNQLFVLRRLT